MTRSSYFADMAPRLSQEADVEKRFLFEDLARHGEFRASASDRSPFCWEIVKDNTIFAYGSDVDSLSKYLKEN